MRFLLFAGLAAAALVAAQLQPSTAGTPRALAVTGPDFQMSVQGDACQPSDAGAGCDITPLSTFTVVVRLDKFSTPVYRAFQVNLTTPTELPYVNRPAQTEIVWPGCEVPYDNPTDLTDYLVGCTINSQTTTYLGDLVEVDYQCGAPSEAIYTITMVQGSAFDATYLVDEDYHFVDPIGGGAKTMTVRCFGTPEPIDYGDASCDGAVNSIDAAVILQYAAALLATLSCAANADVNGDGRVDPLDAALVLQYSAGLITSLGPAATPTPTPLSMPPT
jgi:hypothetical protein